MNWNRQNTLTTLQLYIYARLSASGFVLSKLKSKLPYFEEFARVPFPDNKKY